MLSYNCIQCCITLTFEERKQFKSLYRILHHWLLFISTLTFQKSDIYSLRIYKSLTIKKNKLIFDIILWKLLHNYHYISSKNRCHITNKIEIMYIHFVSTDGSEYNFYFFNAVVDFIFHKPFLLSICQKQFCEQLTPSWSHYFHHRSSGHVHLRRPVQWDTPTCSPIHRASAGTLWLLCSVSPSTCKTHVSYNTFRSECSPFPPSFLFIDKFIF